MSTSWQDQHLRSATLHAVVAQLERTGSDTVPWDASIAEAFADRGDLLAALHGMWLRRLLARLDLALELGEGDTLDSLRSARREVAAELAAVRRVLDHHADDPAVHRCERNENRLLGSLAMPVRS